MFDGHHKYQDEDDNMATSSEYKVKAHRIMYMEYIVRLLLVAHVCLCSCVFYPSVLKGYPAYALVFVFSRFHSSVC